MPAYTGYLIETFVTLAGVCGLAAAILWAARRTGIARSTGPIELRGYLPLDARRAIVLVKVGATVFIVGVGEGGFTKLGEVADADLPATQRGRGPTFAQVLARMRGSTVGLGSRGDTPPATPGGIVGRATEADTTDAARQHVDRADPADHA